MARTEKHPKFAEGNGRNKINSFSGRIRAKSQKLEDDFNRPLTEEEEAYLKEIEKKSSFISFFIPRKGFIATPILMDLNLLIFILMVAFGVGILEPSTLALLKWGADFGPLTLTGDWCAP